MAKLLDMPKLSPTMEEGQIAAWHKKVGDQVAVDDLLAEVETDKATMEFRAFDQGTLLAILAPVGTVVKLGQGVAIVGVPGEDISAVATRRDVPATPAPPPAPAAPSAAAAPASVAAPAPPSPAPASAPSRVRASPYVRMLARERGLDLTLVTGTGPTGRIVARDLAASPPAAPSSVASSRRVPLSMMRKTIARRLTESKQTVPHFYLKIDVDAGPLSALRAQLVADLTSAAKKGEEPEKVSVNDLLLRAVAVALARVPECNARFDGDAIVLHDRVDLSVAVAVADGLVTPVVRDAANKSVLEIAREVRALAALARSKKLAPEQMMDGTFSVSNLGMYGIDEFAAVINPPEGAILAVGRVRDEPVVRDGAVVAGKRLSLTLSCDHRVIDGAVGASFLAELRATLEHPTRILLS